MGRHRQEILERTLTGDGNCLTGTTSQGNLNSAEGMHLHAGAIVTVKRTVSESKKRHASLEF